MFYYNSLYGMAVSHFWIGVGLAVATLIFYEWRQKPRWLLTFKGDIVSLGNPYRWGAWFLLAYIIELRTSFNAPNVYDELSQSLLEACAMTVGFFIVDRGALLFEAEPGERLKPRWNWRAPVDRVKDLWPNKPKTATPETDDDAAEAERIRRMNETLGGR